MRNDGSFAGGGDAHDAFRKHQTSLYEDQSRALIARAIERCVRKFPENGSTDGSVAHTCILLAIMMIN